MSPFKEMKMDQVFFEKSNKIFVDLFNLANEELRSSGLGVESATIVEKVISPLKDHYMKNLSNLLESILQNKLKIGIFRL